jgi:hypothetical protein
MFKPNDDAMVQRCGCYTDAAAAAACIRLLQQRLPSLKALAVRGSLALPPYILF